MKISRTADKTVDSTKPMRKGTHRRLLPFILFPIRAILLVIKMNEKENACQNK